MAKKNTQTKKDDAELSKVKGSKNNQNEPKDNFLKDETRHGIYALVTFVLVLFFTLAAIKKAGVVGSYTYKGFYSLFGYGYFLLPVLGTILGISFLKPERPHLAKIHTASASLFFLTSLGLLDIASKQSAGYIGSFVSWPFIKLFDVYVSVIFLSAILVGSLFVLFDRRPHITPLIEWIKNKLHKKDENEEFEEFVAGQTFDPNKVPEVIEGMAVGTKESNPVENTQNESKTRETKISNFSDEVSDFKIQKNAFTKHATYVPPPLNLLEADKGKANVGDIKANANIIKRTLLNFGIEVEMDEITIGPTFTRYALKPAVGVKLSRIVGLQNDLALALAAHPVRIEAPIPGKSLVGIEIPNKTKAMVGLGALLSDERFQNSPKPLTVALGRDVAGKPHYVNMAKAPHALIAGTTGSGKSVTIHSIVASLLYRNGPEALKLIMVDPKRVELTLYNKIPHLLTPVIIEAKKAILALKWAAKEMERRYDILQSESVRDIESYHDNIVKTYKAPKDALEGTGPDKMPYIVIIIDELADIMQAYPRELEAAIVRLAQMSRAVGIHLILSTQRPEVNVITGLIKANVPTRIALRVPTGIDSRTILDTVGAEKLLGAGDMLYSGGEGQPNRLQSAYITEEEVKKVVKYLSDTYKDEIPELIDISGTNISSDKSIFESSIEGDNDDDDLYETAKQIVVESGKASTSFLQRKLSIGYARAARLIDILEERGVVGPGNGAKPRDVLGGRESEPVNEPEI